MGIKDRFTRLDQVDLLSRRSRKRLSLYGVTTVEELVGLLEADPDAVRRLLKMDSLDVDRLRTQARSLLGSETLAAIDEQRGRIYPLGARDPRIKLRTRDK